MPLPKLGGGNRAARNLLFNLHLYTALIAGVFIAILGVTGSIMAFEPEIDHLVHWKLAHVTPRGRALSLAEIGAAVAKAIPGERIVDYGIGASPGLSYQVVTARRHLLYVNPYTAEVLGMATGPDAVTRFLGNVHQFHLRLLIMPHGSGSDPGKKIMSWAGAAMLFLLLSGLYLWWPLKRVSVQRGGPPRRFWFDLHNTTGIFSFAFLLILTLTGIAIGFDDSAVPLFYKITGSQPLQAPRIQVNPPRDARPIAPDRALEIARGALPGVLPFDINVPGPRGAYTIRARFPEDLTPGGRSIVIVDQYTGSVLYAQSSRTAPGGRRMETLNRALHTGDSFGLPSKIAMSLASLLAAMQTITGFTMLWKRKRE